MVRPYTSDDSTALWRLKREFELTLGSGTGGDAKESVYRDKLDDAYRTSYLEWVDRCIAEDEQCIQIAEAEGEPVGYVFVLPDTLAHIWDAAVLNELYLEQSHRGSGLADDLLEAALARARAQSLPLDRLVLDVDADNERASAFYDRWGFESWGEMVARKL